MIVPLPEEQEKVMLEEGVEKYEIQRAKALYKAAQRFKWNRTQLDDPAQNPFLPLVNKIRSDRPVRDPNTLQDYRRSKTDVYFGVIAADYEVMKTTSVPYDQRLKVVYDCVKPDGELMAVKTHGHDPYFYVRIPKPVCDQARTEGSTATLESYAQVLISKLNARLQDFASRCKPWRREDLLWCLDPGTGDKFGVRSGGDIGSAAMITGWKLWLDHEIKTMVGYRPENDEVLIQVSVAHPMLVVPAKEALWLAQQWLGEGMALEEPFVHHAQGPNDGRRCLMVLEANIPYTTRNVLDSGVTLMGWNKLAQGDYMLVGQERQTTYHRLELECSWDAIHSLHPHPASEADPTYTPPADVPLSSVPGYGPNAKGTLQQTVIPHTMSSEDAEMCKSLKEEIQKQQDHIFAKEESADTFPDERFESIVCWCFNIENVAVPDKSHPVGFSLGYLDPAEVRKNASFKGARVWRLDATGTRFEEQYPLKASEYVPGAPWIFEFLDERKMLEMLHLFKMTLKADIWLGYNTDGFDHPYLENRLMVLGSPQAFHMSYHVNRKMSWKSITVRGRNKTIVSIPGVFSYDLLKQIPLLDGEDFSGFESYSLSYVSKRLLKKTKIDFPHSMVKRAHHTAKGRCRLLIYCFRDCELPKDVVKKYRILPTYDSRMMATEPQHLIDRGSMFRLMNCLLLFMQKLGPKIHGGRRVVVPTKWAQFGDGFGSSGEGGGSEQASGLNDLLAEMDELTVADFMDVDDSVGGVDKTHIDPKKKRKPQYDGAFNWPPRKDRITGLVMKNFYKALAILGDFAGLYPSVEMEKNTCPTTLLLTRDSRDRLQYKEEYECFLEAQLVEAAEPDRSDTDPDWNEISEEEKQRRIKIRDIHRRRIFVEEQYEPQAMTDEARQMYEWYSRWGGITSGIVPPMPFNPALVRPDRGAFVKDKVLKGIVPAQHWELKMIRKKFQGQMNKWAARRDTISGTKTIMGLEKAIEILETAAKGKLPEGGAMQVVEAQEYLSLIVNGPSGEGAKFPEGVCLLDDIPVDMGWALMQDPQDFAVKGTYSEELQSFLLKLDQLKAWAKTEYNTASFENGVYNTRQLATKKIMNSIYGMFGSIFGPCPVMEIAETTTKWGVYFIKYCIAWVEENFRPDKGCPFLATVEYGDTDSMCVVMIRILGQQLPMEQEILEVQKYGELAMKGCNLELKTKLGTRFMSIELEKLFKNFMLDAKKKYMAYWIFVNGKREFKVKGMHCVRSDCSKFIARLQKSVMQQIIEFDDFDGAVEMAIQQLSDLVNHRVPNCDIMRSKSFSRDPEKYTTQQDHVVCALRHEANGTGKRYRAGMRMKTIVVKPDYFPANKMKDAKKRVTQRSEEVLYALDHHMLYDEVYYLEKAWETIRRPMWRCSDYENIETLDARVLRDARLKPKRTMSVTTRQEILEDLDRGQKPRGGGAEGSSSSSKSNASYCNKGKITGFFSRNQTSHCRVCNKVACPTSSVKVGEVTVCFHCYQNKQLDNYLKELHDQLAAEQSLHEECWDTCGGCISDLGIAPARNEWSALAVSDIEEVANQCVADDCPNLYRRKQSKDEIALLHYEMRKLGQGPGTDQRLKYTMEDFSVGGYLMTQTLAELKL